MKSDKPLPRPRDLSGESIVVVEETAYMRTLLTQLIKTFEPQKLDVYQDEEAAIGRMSFAPASSIIIDWRPDEGIGPQLLNFVRHGTSCRAPEAGIVCLATRASRRSVELARDLGANVFVTKPFAAADLRLKIESSIFNPREFVVSEAYVGPDRRHRRGDFDGDDRRSRAAAGAEAARAATGGQ